MCCPPGAKAALDPSPESYTYKTFKTGEAPLQSDVYRSASEGVQPVVVFIHGGALMMGDRKMSTRTGSLLQSLLNGGYTVVSIDYRLAPAAKLPAILEDVEDAIAWVRARGPELFHINPARLFVMGQSAGGYLTLMAGTRVHPAPQGLISFWGYGDIAGPWYSEPDPYYCKQPAVTKEEANQFGAGRLYLYCRQQGLWPLVLTGHDPKKEPQYFEPFCPERNVTANYPPALLFHGTSDTDVPYELSVRMDKALSANNVPHRFITIPQGGHGFSRGDQETAMRAYGQMLDFLKNPSGKTGTR